MSDYVTHCLAKPGFNTELRPSLLWCKYIYTSALSYQSRGRGRAILSEAHCYTAETAAYLLNYTAESAASFNCRIKIIFTNVYRV